VLAIEQLGVATTKSGILLIIDTGYLNLWSHDQVPLLPDGVLSSEEATTIANSSVDLRIVGSDAAVAGRALGMSWHPLFVYDQPKDHPELQAKLDALVRKNQFDARFEVVEERVSHRHRVDLALQQGDGAGEVQFHGVWAVSVSDVPVNMPLSVLAERSESNHQRWKRVIVECRRKMHIARSEKVGFVGVDYARLMIGDVDALGVWEHERSFDGLSDYVFWGRDASEVATAVRAPRLSQTEFGWVNVPEEVAQERGMAVQDYQEKRGLKLAGDYRPHSHHWQVMTQTRKSPTESATIKLAGSILCSFMTTWGDGVFDVYRDLNDIGELVQVRIELEESVVPFEKQQLPTKLT